jgi:hypothetical protein
MTHSSHSSARAPKSSYPKLSKQEEEDQRALEKGYDDEVSGLPDPDGGEAGDTAASGTPPGAAEAVEQPDTLAGRSAAGPRRGPGDPLEDAEEHGLLPGAGQSGPPLDGEAPVSRDPRNPAGSRRG